MKVVFLIVVLLSSPFSEALAGGRLGNGGNAVVCTSESNPTEIVNIELFDFWEMQRATGGDPIDLGWYNLSVEEKISLFLSKVAEYDPARAVRYQDAANRILGQLSEVLVDVLPEIEGNDDHSTYVPVSPCVKRQFAVQIRDPLPGETRFMIDRTLWNAAGNDARAGIVLHEVIYRDAILEGQQTSDLIRLFNYRMASTPMYRITQSDYSQYLSEAGLRYHEVIPLVLNEDRGIKVFSSESRYREYMPHEIFMETLHPLSFQNLEGNLFFNLAAGDLLKVEPRTKRLLGAVALNDPSSTRSIGFLNYQGQKILFNAISIREGKISLTSLRPFVHRMGLGGDVIECGEDRFNFDSVVFTPDLRLIACKNDMEKKFVVHVAGKKVSIHRRFGFYPSGELKSSVLSEPALLNFHSVSSPIEFKGEVTFDQDGDVTSGRCAHPIFVTHAAVQIPLSFIQQRGSEIFGWSDVNSPIESPRVDGNLIIAKKSRLSIAERGELSETICKKMGFDRSWGLATVRVVPTASPPIYFDIENNQTTNVTTPTVNQVESVYCDGAIRISL